MDDFVMVPDSSKEDIEWSLKSFPPSVFVTLDPLTHVVTIQRANAVLVQEEILEEIVFEARDPAGNAVEFRVLVRIVAEGGGEEFSIELPDIGLVAGSRLAIFLDPFVDGIEADQIGWQIDSILPEGFSARIDAETRSIELVAEADFSGSVAIVLLATGPEGKVQQDTLGVTVVLPGLSLGDIPDVELRSGEQDSSLVLDSFVVEGAPEGLIWTVEGAAFVSVAIDPTTHRVWVWAPEGTVGEERLTFIARDGAGQTARTELLVRVREVWQLSDIPDLSLFPEESIVLELDEFVVRGGADVLEWSVTGGRDVRVEIDALRRQALIHAPPLAPIVEELIFSALTPEAQRLVDTVQVAVVVPPLKLREMRDIYLATGQADSSRVLDDYVEFGDPGSVQWTVEGAENLEVFIDPHTHRLQVLAAEGFVGEEILIFTAARGEEIAKESLLVIVQENPPVLQIGDIPDMSLSAARIDSSLVLDRFVEIGDPESVRWTVEGAARIDVQIDTETRRVRLLAGEAFEPEVLVFIARLDGESVSDTVRIVFVEELPHLELSPIPELKVIQGRIDSSLVLDPFLVEGDPEAATWLIRGGRLVRATIDGGSRRVRIDASQAQTGVEIFFVEVTREGASASAVLRVAIKAARFSLLSLPKVAVGSDQESVALDLDPFVEGDFAPEQIHWEASSSDDLIVSIDPLTHVVQLTPVAGFVGGTQLVLTAQTPPGESRQVILQVEVAGAEEKAPEIAAFPELFPHPGTSVDALDLDDFVLGSDPESLVWRVVGEGEIALSVDPRTHVLTLQIPSAFSGEEIRQLGVRHAAGELEVQVELTIKVLAQNEPPLLFLPAEIVLPVGEVFELDLYALVEDRDTEDALIFWIIDEEGGLEIQVDAAAGRLTLFSPVFRESPARLLLTAVDPQGNRADGIIQVRFLKVDTQAPELRFEVVGHRIFSELLEIRVYADEPLVGRVSIEVDGDGLAVEEEEDHYRTLYPVAQEGVLDIAASGTDANGNTGLASLQIAVKWLVETGGTAFSPDGRLQVNIPDAISGPGRMILLYATKSGETQEEFFYVDILGVDEPRDAVEIVFRDFAGTELENPVVMRRDRDGEIWEELVTQTSRGLLFASATELGMFKVGDSEVEEGIEAQVERAYPNPFNIQVAIRYLIEEEGPVRINIYNLQGHPVCTLIDRIQKEGPWTAVWEGIDGNGLVVASGVYLYVIETTSGRRTGKMTLLR